MLKVEIITPNMPEQKASRWFCKQLSAQITPRLTECIEQDHLRNYAEKLMCIALDLGKLTDLIIVENKCMVNAKVSAISDSFIIGYFTLFWESESGKVVYPWDQNCGDTLHFGMYISKSEIKRLNFCLPPLYNPVVKSTENQLGFDYQIYYTNDGKLTVYAQDAFSQEELLSIKDTVISFVQKQCFCVYFYL